MGNDMILSVDRLITSPLLQPLQGSNTSGSSTSSHTIDSSTSIINIPEELENDESEEEKPLLLQTMECRICQEEDTVKNLETPCHCNGSLKFAHRKCVQRWCNEKGDIICEICHQTYQPGYTAPPPRIEDASIDISGGWNLDADPRILAMAAAERHLHEADDDIYADSSASGAAFCRSAALILLALLLLRHALTITNADGNNEDDIITFFSLFLLRAGGFLLPCYIMAWAISILQRRRQRQEEAAMAAAEVAYILQAAQQRGLQVTIGSGHGVVQEQPLTPRPEPV